MTTFSKLAFQIYTCLTRVCSFYTISTQPSVAYTAASQGSMTGVTPIDARYFPYSFIKFELTYTCSNHDIPMGG